MNANSVIENLAQFLQKNETKKHSFRADNIRTLHCIQALQTNTSLSNWRTETKPSLLHKIMICGTQIIFQLC